MSVVEGSQMVAPYNSRWIAAIIFMAFRVCVLMALIVSAVGCTRAKLSEPGMRASNSALRIIQSPISLPAGAQPAPIRFGKLTSNLRKGSPIGEYVFGLMCFPPYDYITWAARSLNTDPVREHFHTILTDAGFDVSGSPTRLFDEEEDLARAVLVVSGRVVDAALSVCRRKTFFFLVDAGVTGEAAVRIDWTVYSNLLRMPIFQTTTEGRSQSPGGQFDGENMLLEDAVASAIDALAADNGFREAVLDPRPRDLPVLEGPPRRNADGQLRPNIAAEARVSLMLPRVPLLKDAMRSGRAEDVALATVLIETGDGYGSGFYIGPSPDGGGLVLTNAHVIGDAEQVRVSPVHRGDGPPQIGQVLRRHRLRDVALVRTPEPPSAVFAIRTRSPVIGEDVFAIGAPEKKELRGTVTRGVVSAFRTDRHSGLETVQADVTIRQGSSGGPLVDGDGNVVGLSVSGFAKNGVLVSGLNFFVPIMDALEKLNVRLSHDKN
ncbi:Peptidase Do [Azospirillaceae bacterium]